jgi:hypothetical protein
MLRRVFKYFGGFKESNSMINEVSDISIVPVILLFYTSVEINIYYSVGYKIMQWSLKIDTILSLHFSESIRFEMWIIKHGVAYVSLYFSNGLLVNVMC